MTQKETRLLIAAMIHFRNRAARDGLPTEDINALIIKLKPSREDIQSTDKLIKAFRLIDISVLDHIILGPDNRFYSLREQNEFPVAHAMFLIKLIGENTSAVGCTASRYPPAAG